MALSIKNPEADRMVREIISRTGEGITEAVMSALKERLQRLQGKRSAPLLTEELAAIRKRCATLRVIDPRSPDEILGYGPDGVPH